MFTTFRQLYLLSHLISLSFLALICFLGDVSLTLANENTANISVVKSANSQPWISSRLNKNQQVEYRNIADSNLIEIRATMTVKSSLSAVLLFLQDTRNIPLWLHNASHSEIVESITVNENISITSFDAFWPVKTREMVIRSRYWQNENLSIEVVIIDESNNYLHLISKDAIPINILSAKWKISPLTNGDIHIEHVIIANPNGSIPHWLANRIALKSIWKTLINIKEQLPYSHYQQEKLINISELSRN